MTTSVPQRVLACLDDSTTSEVVHTTALNVSRAIHADLDLVSVVASSAPADEHSPVHQGEPVRVINGPVEATLIDELARDDVALGVLGTRALTTSLGRLGHVARAVVTSSRRPLIVMPPEASPLAAVDQRFLVPLDGRSSTSQTIGPLLAELIEPMGTIVPLHVFDDEHLPMFVSSADDRDVLADDFAARHLGRISAERPRLRLGEPVEEILAAIAREDADAVVVCWSQQLGAGHAAVIRGLLEYGDVGVILQPMPETE